MKHRSVIAFVIVAAALFAAPQLSHDLQSLRNGLGARLRGELLQAFLSLHPADGASAAPASRAARTLVATCTKGGAGAPAAKARKDERRAAAEPRSEETAAQLAMITKPVDGPDTWQAQDALAHMDAVAEAVAVPAEVASEVAMIIPPDAGLDPPVVANLSATRAKAREGAALKRKEAEEIRRVTLLAARFDGRQAERHGPAEEALRKLNETLPGSVNFRFEVNGQKTKTLKVIKRAVEAGRPAAAPAPRALRLPGLIACVAPATAAGSQEWPAGE